MPEIESILIYVAPEHHQVGVFKVDGFTAYDATHTQIELEEIESLGTIECNTPEDLIVAVSNMLSIEKQKIVLQ